MSEVFPMEDPEPPEDYDLWLSEQEQQKVKEIEKHMQLAFDEIFGGQDE